MPLLQDFLSYPSLADALESSGEAIAAVHRRPVNLRKVPITSSEACVRGAKLLAQAQAPNITVEDAVAAFSVLAPDAVDATARTFRRAPLQVIAQIDTLAGGEGRPEEGTAPAAQELAAMLSADPHPGLVLAVVHAVIVGKQVFGQRSLLVACVAARAAAITFGFDPRGLCVPELHLVRNLKEYEDLVHNALTSRQALADLMVMILQAWRTGAAEAEGIAKAAS